MKKYIINSMFLVAMIFATTSCDLELQEQFEFDPSIPELTTFEDQTVWEWLSTNPNDEYNFMLEAIERAGLEEMYKATDKQRTFLLLKDRAWTDRGELLQHITGSQDGKIEDIPVETLQKVLKYHVVDDYVDQGPVLFELFADYTFDTMLEGEYGIITFQRDERFRLRMNWSENLPSTKKRVGSALHNYVFSNGVAHLMIDYTTLLRFERM